MVDNYRFQRHPNHLCQSKPMVIVNTKSIFGNATPDENKKDPQFEIKVIQTRELVRKDWK